MLPRILQLGDYIMTFFYWKPVIPILESFLGLFLEINISILLIDLCSKTEPGGLFRIKSWIYWNCTET
jgi:hypothetical protein